MSDNATLRQGAHILTLIGQKIDDKAGLTALVETGLLADLLGARNIRSINRDEFRRLIGLKPLTSDKKILVVNGEEYEYRYFSFGQTMDTDLVIDAIEKEDRKNPWQPASLEHLRSCIEADGLPKRSFHSSIVALGHVKQTKEKPYVSTRTPSGILWRKGPWKVGYYFLAVRKVIKDQAA